MSIHGILYKITRKKQIIKIKYR